MLTSIWKNLSLAQQFAVAALMVILPGTIFTGWWISERISDAVVKNTAEATIIYMDGLLAPILPELEASSSLSLESQQKLDAFQMQARADNRIVSIKIWRLDGTIIYSTFPEMIGKKFEPSESFVKAAQGELGASFDEDAHDEDVKERETGHRLLEVYAPIRHPETRKIIAVSEFYAPGDRLAADVASASRWSWLVVAAAASTLVGALSFVVSRGSRTIINQRRQLEKQVDELQTLLNQNETLRSSLRQANENVTQVNENVLQRVGADLHDGPAQMLAFAMLRVSRIQKLVQNAKVDSNDLAEMSAILKDTLREVRNLSTGLSLPELKNSDLATAVQTAVDAHKNYTNTQVDVKIDLKQTYQNEALKICAYRFVQEALGNANKHAGGLGQSVRLSDADGIVITVSDKGKGLQLDEIRKPGLGLFGMQSRIEALGGTLHISNLESGGTQLQAKFQGQDVWRT